jgi:putative peptide zinc metalloprotease protein
VRRLLAALAISLLTIVGAPIVAGAQTSDDNAAIAVNTQDGASVFRLALSVRMVVDGVVDQTNTAAALASCVDCQTVALAFQVVLVRGDADVVVPENQAVAYNDQCVECVTYASATQIVLGFDGHVRLTGDGRRRIAEWYRTVSGLEDEVGSMTVAELAAAVQAAKLELVDILSTELVENPPGGNGTTTTTAAPTSSSIETTTTSTTEPDATSTTSTTMEVTTTTSTTESPTTTTSTGPTTTVAP